MRSLEVTLAAYMLVLPMIELSMKLCLHKFVTLGACERNRAHVEFWNIVKLGRLGSSFVLPLNASQITRSFGLKIRSEIVPAETSGAFRYAGPFAGFHE